jgi:hypothetical protein
MANLPIIFNICTIVDCQELTIIPQSTNHNGRPWYCIDEPTCDQVIYWGTSGTTNLWIYSLDGLDGTISSVLDNNYEYPVTQNNFNEEVGFWNNISETDFMDTSIFAFYTDITQCSKTEDFDDCINELTEYFGPTLMTTLMEKGIVEQGSIGGKSGVCRFKEILLSINPSFTPQEIYDYYFELLDKGIVLDTSNGCSGTGSIVTSVETYLKYAEAVGLTQSAAVP